MNDNECTNHTLNKIACKQKIENSIGDVHVGLKQLQFKECLGLT
jgi:hypothetical protein